MWFNYHYNSLIDDLKNVSYLFSVIYNCLSLIVCSVKIYYQSSKIEINTINGWLSNSPVANLPSGKVATKFIMSGFSRQNFLHPREIWPWIFFGKVDTLKCQKSPIYIWKSASSVTFAVSYWPMTYSPTYAECNQINKSSLLIILCL